jgi:uncharacterized protein
MQPGEIESNPPMTYLLLFLFGSAIGVMSGLLGIGGGIALVPGLMLLFGFSQQEAQGTSLAVLVPPIGIFAAMVYYQHGFVRLPVVGWVALGFVLGALAGAKLVPVVPPVALRVAFGLMLLYVGFMFVMTPLSLRPSSALPAGIATLAAFVGSRFFRRWRRPPKPELPRPSSEIEYHI